MCTSTELVEGKNSPYYISFLRHVVYYIGTDKKTFPGSLDPEGIILLQC